MISYYMKSNHIILFSSMVEYCVMIFLADLFLEFHIGTCFFCKNIFYFFNCILVVLICVMLYRIVLYCIFFLVWYIVL